AHDRLSADIVAAARPVLDKELLAEPLRQPARKQARGDVGRRTGGRGDDDAHRAQRIGLRPAARGHRWNSSASGETQKVSAGQCHAAFGLGALALLQGIALTFIDRDGADRSWIRTSSPRKAIFSHAVSMQQPWKTVISFDAARLGIDSVFLVALQSEF